jgi:hypothetical protein
LKNITQGYNKKPHCVTKIEPEKAFMIPNKKNVAEIRERTEKYYQSRIQTSMQLNLNDEIGICFKNY